MNLNLAQLTQVVNKQETQIASLLTRVTSLENPDRDNWMSIRRASKHPNLKGKLSEIQIRDRVLKSIASPETAPFIANVHYQVIPGNDRNNYTVNPLAIAQWLTESTKHPD